MGRVLLLGYFGAGNLGDDGLLVDWLLRYGEPLHSRGVAVDVLKHEQPALAGFTESPRARAYVTDELPRRALLSLPPRQYSALVAPGGSLLQDATSLRSLGFYLAGIRRFARAGVPVYMLHQGVGPLRNPLARYFTPQVLSLTRMLALRDSTSYGWSKQQLALVAHKELYLSADPLLAARLKAAPTGHAEPYFAVVPKAPWDEQATQFGQAAGALARLVGVMQQASGLPALVLALHGEQDGRFAEQVAAQAGAQLAPTGGPARHSEAIGWLAGARFALSYRLHGLVLSAAHGVPALGVAYDPKVAAYCRELEQPSVRPQDVLRGQADRAALGLIESRDALTRNLLARRAAMLERLAKAESRFERLLEGKLG